MNKLIAGMFSFLMVVSLAAPAGARTYVPGGVNPTTEDKIAFLIEDRRDTPAFISNLNRFTPMDQLPSLGNRWCRSFTSENCKLEDGYTLFASAILPVCVGTENHCVEGLRLQASGSAPVSAKHVSGIPEGLTFPSLGNLGTPRGDGPSLWTADGVDHEGGSNQYVVAVNLSFYVVNGTSVRYQDLSAAVYPVDEIDGPRYRAPFIENRIINGVSVWNHGNGEQGSNDGCTLTAPGKCWARTGFFDGVRAEVSLRTTPSITGWLHGRLKQPNISIESISRESNRIVVSAESVDVPLMYAETQFSNLETETKRLFDYPHGGTGGFAVGDRWTIFQSFNPKARELIAKFSKSVNDKAAALYSSWQFNTISSQQGNQPCFNRAEGLVGLVTTNAMAYDQNPPVFKDGFLEYSVAGLHYLPDGRKALGVYDLVIDSDVARCLYGFSNAPVSAKVSVLTSDGESVIASTQVSEKDGWLKLAAYGFTFSEKKITVKVTQPATATLARFKQGVSRLSAMQKQQLDLFATKASGASKITCSSTYFGSNNKVVALAQAKAACGFVIAKNPDSAVEIKTVVVKRVSDALRVFLKSA